MRKHVSKSILEQSFYMPMGRRVGGQHSDIEKLKS
jgi:hypothetical protein